VQVDDKAPIDCGFQLDHLSVDQQHELAQLLSEFSCFNDLSGSTTVATHCIELKAGSKPVTQSPYRVNSEKDDLIGAEINKMKDMGVIEDGHSPWASPVVLIPKPDGSVRFCIDYRKVNDLTVPDTHPMPRIDDLIDKIGSAKFKTKVDLS